MSCYFHLTTKLLLLSNLFFIGCQSSEALSLSATKETDSTNINVTINKVTYNQNTKKYFAYGNLIIQSKDYQKNINHAYLDCFQIQINNIYSNEACVDSIASVLKNPYKPKDVKNSLQVNTYWVFDKNPANSSNNILIIRDKDKYNKLQCVDLK